MAANEVTGSDGTPGIMSGLADRRGGVIVGNTIDIPKRGGQGLSDEAGGHALNTKVTGHEYRRFRTLAKKANKTISAHLRTIVRDYLKRVWLPTGD